MTNRKIVDSLEEEFLELVEEKNSWGKNELKGLFSKAVANHYIKVVDDEDKLGGTVLKKRRTKTVTEEYKPKVFQDRRK